MEQDPQPITQSQAIEPQFVEPEPAAAGFAPPSPSAPSPSGSSAAPARSRANAARLLNLALIGALVLAVAGVGFATGRMTAPAQAASIGTGRLGGDGFVRNGYGQFGTGQFGNGGGQGPVGIGGAGGLTIEGTVESVTGTTMTIKTADGQTQQVALDASTTYHAQTDASSDDVATGGK
ncbi:MAG: hypothetical protein ACREBE_22150, partial [bacterium]